MTENMEIIHQNDLQLRFLELQYLELYTLDIFTENNDYHTHSGQRQ